MLPLSLMAVAGACIAGRPPAEPPVRVVVVVVLASRSPTGIDPKLADLAREVQKRNAALLGFRLAATLQATFPVGRFQRFELPEDHGIEVRCDYSMSADGRLGLTVNQPENGSVTYSIVPKKFFPVVTRFTTRADDQLIVAIMARPDR